MSSLSSYRVLALCALLSVPSSALFAQADGLKVIKPANSPSGPSAASPGVLAGNTLYLSGQDGRNADGSVPKDFSQEVSQALSHVQEVLHAAGMDYKDLASTNIYLKTADNITAMNEVYWKAMGERLPARSVLVVADLPNGENIEMNAIAVHAARWQTIHPQGWPQGPHVDPAALQADDVLYLSAQGGVDPATGKPAADFAAEVKQAMENVSTILKTANMAMTNVVWVNPYMSSTGAQERTMNRTYSTYFEIGNLPGRGTFTVVDLPDHNHIFFSCIAGADLAKRKIVRPKNEKPSATSTPGILYGNTLYLSAKDAYVPALGIISPDLDIQTKLSMRNLLDGLQEADMDFSNIVSDSVYLREIKDEAQLDPIYSKFFKGYAPAQTVLQQNANVKDIDTEQISVIAVGTAAH